MPWLCSQILLIYFIWNILYILRLNIKYSRLRHQVSVSPTICSAAKLNSEIKYKFSVLTLDAAACMYSKLTLLRKTLTCVPGIKLTSEIIRFQKRIWMAAIEECNFSEISRAYLMEFHSLTQQGCITTKSSFSHITYKKLLLQKVDNCIQELGLGTRKAFIDPDSETDLVLDIKL